MLKGKLIHPEILSALAFCGHGDKILIADGNFPLDTKSGDAKRVYLALTPGQPGSTEVLAALLEQIKVEAAEVMSPGEGSPAPELFGEFSSLLGGMELRGLDRWAFYDACGKPEVRLAIATGEKRPFGNILLTVGVV